MDVPQISGLTPGPDEVKFDENAPSKITDMLDDITQTLGVEPVTQPKAVTSAAVGPAEMAAATTQTPSQSASGFSWGTGTNTVEELLSDEKSLMKPNLTFPWLKQMLS